MNTPRPLPEGLSPSPFRERRWRVAERGDAFVRTNLFPSTLNGQLLFIPKDLAAQTPFQTSQRALCDTAVLLQQAPTALRECLDAARQPEGFTIGWNIGVAGGQSIGHAHAHIIGRKVGDDVAKDGTRTGVRGGVVRVLPCTDLFYDDAAPHAPEALDAGNVLMENERAVVIASPHPVVANHAIVLPKSGTASFFDLTPAEIASMVALAGTWLAQRHGLNLDDAGGDKGANIGWNIGAAAGQVYRSSAALEVIPRTLGDVAKPRGGIARIIPPVADDYYRGTITGIATDATGQTVTADLDARREAYFTELTAALRRSWLAERHFGL